MMTRSLWIAAFLAAMVLPFGMLSAQEKPPAPAPQEQSAPEPRIDIDFPGGTMVEFGRYLQEALGKPPSLILSQEAEQVELPPIRLHAVTVREAMMGIERLQQLGPFSLSIQDSKGGVVTVRAERLKYLWPITSVFDVGRTFSGDIKVDDVVTAIQTVWSMQSDEQRQKPELRYHPETRLLIVKGMPNDIAVAREVVNELAAARERTLARDKERMDDQMKDYSAHMEAKLKDLSLLVDSYQRENTQLKEEIKKLKSKLESADPAKGLGYPK